MEEVLADTSDAPGAGIDLIVGRHKLETVFSEGALADAAAATLDAEGALAAGYRDLRDRFTFTIDPADAKDFDDASAPWIHLEGRGGCGRARRAHRRREPLRALGLLGRFGRASARHERVSGRPRHPHAAPGSFRRAVLARARRRAAFHDGRPVPER